MATWSQDPEARSALSLVGSDPNATAYWASAINDPTLPSEERKDLIEDLNEDGLSDPKHPGPQDLPLIMNRLQLIEEFSPNSMDSVDKIAFAEAYKDLLGTLNGRPPHGAFCYWGATSLPSWLVLIVSR